MSYATLRNIHVFCVMLSVTGFALRGLLVLNNSTLQERPWLRIAPHINDAILLSAAIALAVYSGQYPFVHSWLTAKFIGLAVYITLGSLALKPGRAKWLRVSAYIMALSVVGWMITVAITRNPLGYFSPLI